MHPRVEKVSSAVGSLSGRVVLPCQFSISSHLPIASAPADPTTPPPLGLTSPVEQIRIKWTKLDGTQEKVVLVAHEGVVKIGQEFQGRVSVPSRPLTVGDASLAIMGLRASDAGLYRCEVMHGMEDTQDTVSLHVNGESISSLT